MFTPKLLGISQTRFPPGLRLVGEIDATNASLLVDVLAGARRAQRDLHIDVSQLIFCDTSGIAAFVKAAKSATDSHLVLHGLPTQLEEAMDVVGWGKLLGLHPNSAKVMS